MIGTAWAADAAGEHGGIFSDPAFWVGVAFVLFFALAGSVGCPGGADHRPSPFAAAATLPDRAAVSAGWPAILA